MAVSSKSHIITSPKSKAKIAEVRQKFVKGKPKLGESANKIVDPKHVLAIAISESQPRGPLKKHRKNSKKATKAAILTAGATIAAEKKKFKKKPEKS